VGDPRDRLAALLAPDLDLVARRLRERMASDAAPRIPAVTAHLTEAGGKRLRPMLLLAAARLCGTEGTRHADLAAAVEFIHTATLLHDDVVDESKQRRGRPTANLLWDNMSSVLVGDYLFARAFQLMVEAGSLDVLAILSEASAVIAEGEVLQLACARNLLTTEETYLRVVRGKTAALFSAATEAGAVIAGADAGTREALRAYGDALGVAFQIADDLLDLEGGETIGKDRGDDLREGKMTLPVIRALLAATDDERAFWRRTLGLGEVGEGDLAQAQAILRRHGALEGARAAAAAWGGAPARRLRPWPPTPSRTSWRNSPPTSRPERPEGGANAKGRPPGGWPSRHAVRRLRCGRCPWCRRP
jgi:octaprenyl-diphosphate synthase